MKVQGRQKANHYVLPRALRVYSQGAGGVIEHRIKKRRVILLITRQLNAEEWKGDVRGTPRER